MIDFSKEPCGHDGLQFPNGLPESGQKTMIRTVWSKGDFVPAIYQETYAWGKTYGWFGVYAKPDVAIGSLPIVLEWMSA